MLISTHTLDKVYCQMLEKYSTGLSPILILAAYDFDALCSGCVLALDNVSYKIQCVPSFNDLSSVRDEAEIIVCLNCFGTIDVEELFHPKEGQQFFIFDSLQPTNVMNVYSTQFVSVFSEQSLQEFPTPSEVMEDETEAIEVVFPEDDEDASLPVKRRRSGGSHSPSKRMKSFCEGSFFSSSCCGMMYSLAQSLQKLDNDILWKAILSSTFQFVNKEISRDDYCLKLNGYNRDVLLLNSADSNHKEEGRIEFAEEYLLLFPRHWDLFQSLQNSPFLSVRLQTWNSRGVASLQDLLAKAGLPLSDCFQSYAHMSYRVKSCFDERLTSIFAERNLENLKLQTFTRVISSSVYSAFDVVYAVEGVLCHSATRLASDCFNDAFDALSQTNRSMELLQSGISSYQRFIQAVMKTSNTILSRQSIRNSRFFRFIKVSATSDSEFYRSPQCLRYLAQYLISIQVARKKWTGDSCKPLLICCQVEDNNLLVIGCTFHSLEIIPKNSLSKFFLDLSKQHNYRKVEDDCLLLPGNELDTMLESLQTLME